MSINNFTAPMIRITLAVLVVVLSINMFPTFSHGDQADVEKGQKLFQEKGCVACHSIGKGKITGPDLLGVTERRDKEWIRKWLKSPETMLMTDPVAKQLLQEYMVPMPNQGLNDEEIEIIINYFGYEDSQKSNGNK
jgi:mono/diheme cytochrome c family protein